MPASPTDPLWRRHLAELVVVALGFVVVVGLWVGNRDDGTRTPARAVASTSTAPGADTGGPGTDATSTAPSTEATSDTSSGDEALADAVLRASDLPKGWARAAVAGAPGALCAGQDPFARAGAVATERAAFSLAAEGTVLGATVASFDGPTAAGAFLQRVRQAAGACSSGSVPYSLRSLDDTGDDALAISFSVPTGSSTLRGFVYAARVGARVATVTSTGAEADDDLALRALRAQVGRL